MHEEKLKLKRNRKIYNADDYSTSKDIFLCVMELNSIKRKLQSEDPADKVEINDEIIDILTQKLVFIDHFLTYNYYCPYQTIISSNLPLLLMWFIKNVSITNNKEKSFRIISFNLIRNAKILDFLIANNFLEFIFDYLKDMTVFPYILFCFTVFIIHRVDFSSLFDFNSFNEYLFSMKDNYINFLNDYDEEIKNDKLYEINRIVSILFKSVIIYESSLSIVMKYFENYFEVIYAGDIYIQKNILYGSLLAIRRNNTFINEIFKYNKAYFEYLSSNENHIHIESLVIIFEIFYDILSFNLQLVDYDYMTQIFNLVPKLLNQIDDSTKEYFDKLLGIIGQCIFVNFMVVNIILTPSYIIFLERCLKTEFLSIKIQTLIIFCNIILVTSDLSTVSYILNDNFLTSIDVFIFETNDFIKNIFVNTLNKLFFHFGANDTNIVSKFRNDIIYELLNEYTSTSPQSIQVICNNILDSFFDSKDFIHDNKQFT